MRRHVGLAMFAASLCVGLIGVAYAQAGFYPRDNPDGLDCSFRPVSHAADSETAIGDHPASEGDVVYLLGEVWFTPAHITKARKVFDYYEAKYRIDVDEGRIYMPCKYYSDPSFLMSITTALFAPGDDYPEITIKKL